MSETIVTHTYVLLNLGRQSVRKGPLTGPKQQQILLIYLVTLN